MYTQCENQSQERRQHIPSVRTDRRRGGSIGTLLKFQGPFATNPAAAPLACQLNECPTTVPFEEQAGTGPHFRCFVSGTKQVAAAWGLKDVALCISILIIRVLITSAPKRAPTPCGTNYRLVTNYRLDTLFCSQLGTFCRYKSGW